MQKVRILLVNDQTIVRAGLRMLIEAQADMEVAGESKGSRNALSKAGEVQPDLIIIDIQMAEASGIKTIEHLLRICPHTRILVLTGYESPTYALSALAAGALGYVSMHAETADLLTAIRSVAQGNCFVDRRLISPLLQEFLHKRETRPAVAVGVTSLLSTREREVLVLLAQGYTNREVADHVGLSVKTVETYRARVMSKLALHSRADLIRYAHESGMATPNIVAS